LDRNTEVRAFLDEYRQAHEQKDLNRLSALYVKFTPRQRDALRAYLDNAIDLKVDLEDLEIEPSDSDIVISCTRRDSFKDGESGKRQRLEVHLTQLLVREGEKWKIADER
jgi:ketosteroid isomerase-like protein